MTTSATNFLITGTNRGIGLGFVKGITETYPNSRVFATVRDPSNCKELDQIAQNNKNIHILKCGKNLLITDISSESDIDSLYQNVEKHVKQEGLQYLINNAAIFRKDKDQTSQLPQAIASENFDSFMDSFKTNKFIPLLIKGNDLLPVKHSVVVNISSLAGSISDANSGGNISYRTSKAALNMVGKCLAVDLAKHKIITISLTPGWVRTEMGGYNAPIGVEESVRGMLKVLANISPKHNGAFINYQGKTLPW